MSEATLALLWSATELGTASQSSSQMASEKGPYLILLGPPGAGKGTLVSSYTSMPSSIIDALLPLPSLPEPQVVCDGAGVVIVCRQCICS